MLPDAALFPRALIPPQPDEASGPGPPTCGSLLLGAIYRLAGIRAGRDLPASDIVTLSAQTCAAARAVETDRGAAALIDDPLARVLAGSQYGLALSRAPVRPRIAIRARYFDAFVRTRLPACAQLVLLGAGMDTRAYRLECVTRAHRVFEVDFRSVVDAKEFLLGTMRPPPAPRAPVARVRADIGADTGQWLRGLAAAGFDPDQPTVWVAEGLLYYLEPERVAGLLREVRALSAPGSWVCFSAVTRLAGVRKGLATAFKSAIPDPMAAVADAGFAFYSSDVLGGPNANFRRWPVATPAGAGEGKRLSAPGPKSATVYVKCFVEDDKPTEKAGL